ncbi:HNH endonuclease [Pseudoduganella danionis]|uniref:HNH nuclease domain-containing protein n=1 Tax=Pseudoduganella danionis TaxID=1890295 RepID=A0ABW9SPT2_9BURK|nr:HNH endonuclease [Pseudoduganella danionis]MTW32682.1 hypothetical protein [Pseudoduganella danionis]
MELFIILIGVLAIATVYSIGVAAAKPVQGSDFYKVSKDGRVLAAGRRKIHAVRPKVTPHGLQVKLRNGKRTGEFLVHHLVAEAHLPNPAGHSHVRHRDGNPRNNKVSNLVWIKAPAVEAAPQELTRPDDSASRDALRRPFEISISL